MLRGMSDSLMTEEEVEDLSQATADALAKVDYDITRWKEAGAISPGVVALLYAWFSNQIYQNGLSGWVGNGYAAKGEHRVLAAITRKYAGVDPDMASVLLEAFQQIERNGAGDRDSRLPGHLDALLWERPMRRLRFGFAAAARWNEAEDPFALPAPVWEPPRAPLAPQETGPVRYPGVAVGLTEHGAHLPVRMEDFGTFDYLSVSGAVARGLWRAGVSSEEIRRFLSEASADRQHLGEICARWISFDGDGGDATRFRRIHDALHPPDPLLFLFPEVKAWHGLFVLPAGEVQRVREAMPDKGYMQLEQPAAELSQALRHALRWDPDSIGVLRGDTLSAFDTEVFEVLVTAAQTGHRVLVFGLREEARQALRLMAARFSTVLMEPTRA